MDKAEKKTKQEKRALMYAMRKSDGENVTIPFVVARAIMIDLEALKKVRYALKRLEQ